jgi:hypothetical protein
MTKRRQLVDAPETESGVVRLVMAATRINRHNNQVHGALVFQIASTILKGAIFAALSSPASTERSLRDKLYLCQALLFEFFSRKRPLLRLPAVRPSVVGRVCSKVAFGQASSLVDLPSYFAWPRFGP